jgi:NitT/TauT family transport system substrate-binding protein
MRLSLILAAVICLLSFSALAETPIKIGTTRTAISIPIYMAIEEGYFADAGLSVTLVDFPTGPSAATAVAAGSLQFGATPITAALFNLAPTIKIISALSYTIPGEPGGSVTLAVSPDAWAHGFHAFSDLPGHTVAFPVAGSTLQYGFELLAQNNGVDPNSMTYAFLQSVPNQIAAVVANKADAAILNSALTVDLIAKGQINQIPWPPKISSNQLSVIYTSADLIRSNPALIASLLKAVRHGAADYVSNPQSAVVLAIMVKYTGLSEAQLLAALPHIDRNEGLLIEDLTAQLKWLQSKGWAKPETTMREVLATQFITRTD